MDTDPRVAAARILAQVLGEGRSLATTLPQGLAGLNGSPRALAQELCYGTLRWYPRLAALLKPLLKRPMKRRDRDVYALLLMGLYQLEYLSVPAHAAVTETVEAAHRLGKTWAAGLVNAVLRGFQRDRQRLTAGLDRDPEAAYAHPAWLLQALQDAWPEDWPGVVAANNARPPMTLRVNARRIETESYRHRLAEAGLAAAPAPHAAQGLVLEHPVDVERLPGFRDGDVSVQDAAAQLAASLLDLRPGMRVLDACAAPGGKTGHILECQAGLAELVALDVDTARLHRVQENLARLGLEARLVAGDGALPEAWWDGQGFDRILLDAPCSATGVIRRHPDIKVLRRGEDIAALAESQARLLDALWPLLVSGGMLLYATCSVLPRENDEQIAAFLGRHPDAQERSITADWGRSRTHGRQILPGDDGMDGFYYACLVKR